MHKQLIINNFSLSLKEGFKGWPPLNRSFTEVLLILPYHRFCYPPL